MERMLATPADAEIILKLYQLRTEALMREARAWMTGEFWPNTPEEFFAVAQNPADPHNAPFPAGGDVLGDGGGDGAARSGVSRAVCGLQCRRVLPSGEVRAHSREPIREKMPTFFITRLQNW